MYVHTEGGDFNESNEMNPHKYIEHTKQRNVMMNVLQNNYHKRYKFYNKHLHNETINTTGNFKAYMRVFCISITTHFSTTIIQ